MMRARRGLALDAALLAAWALAIGAMLLHERGLLGRGAVNPATLLRTSDAIERNEQWFGISYQGQRIGFAHTLVTPAEFEGRPGLQVVDQGQMAFTLLSQPQLITVRSSGFIDADWRLQRFKASLESGTYLLKWSGARAGDTLHISVASGASRYETQLYDPTGSAFAAGLVSWTAFHELREGQWGRFLLLNPMALRPEEAFFHVRRREAVGGEEALVVETEFRGLTTTTWVTPEGVVLRESSPLGWELTRISREDAMKTQAAPPAMDLLTTTAVPLTAPLPPPEARARMVWLIEGLTCADVPATGGQRPLPSARISLPEPPAGKSCAVELRQVAPPDGSDTGAPPLKRFLEPSLTVQSDHERLQAQARAIVGDATDPWTQAQAVNAWVHGTLTKRLTVGLPTALDVLISRSGDCHEHTVLFAALTRSLGIPTRLLAGLVAYEGRLFYHAWPEVWVGRWVPVDPTLGQPVADATHLALVEAENEQLVSLAQWIGQLRVRPMSPQEAEADGE